VGRLILFSVSDKFDDDKVTVIKSDEIPKLEGGGEYHSAYLCLYRARALE
jgi:ubiquitin carboxyl-terminal hydrolase 14